MKNKEIVQEIIGAMDIGDVKRVTKYLTSDFKFTGVKSDPISKDEWVSVHYSLFSGMPDIQIDVHDITESGKVVKAMVSITGTHTKDLKIPVPGYSKIEATGKAVEMPKETFEFTFNSQQRVSAMHVVSAPNGGIKGLIQNLKDE